MVGLLGQSAALLRCYVWLLFIGMCCLASPVTTATTTTAACNSFPPSELDALKSLYESTLGINWEWQPLTTGNKWSFVSDTVNPCSDDWQGISCVYTTSSGTKRDCFVEKLNLDNYNLVGSIPGSLAQLSMLTSLDLSSNPHSVCSLQSHPLDISLTGKWSIGR